MNTFKTAVSASLFLLLGGCIPVPIPWKASNPRLAAVKVESIEAGKSTREDVLRILSQADPDLRRGNDRYWVFGWSQGHGKIFVLPLAPLIAGDVGPVYSSLNALFLEFDSHGVLTRKELGHKAGGDRICTSNGICVEGWAEVCDSPQEGVESCSPGRLDPQTSRFLLAPLAPGESIDTAASEPGRCRLFLTTDPANPDERVEFRLDEPPAAPAFKLPKDAYVDVTIPAGGHRISGCGNASATYTCKAGESVALSLGGSLRKSAICRSTEFPTRLLESTGAVPWLQGKRWLLMPGQ